MDAYGAAGKVNVCIQEGLNFVKQLGVKLLKKFSTLTVIFNLIKAKQLMKGKTVDMLLTYPLANDPTKIAAMRIINTIVTPFAVQARLNDLMAKLTLINTQLVLKYGVTDEAGAILSNYGFLIAWTGDFDEGRRIGETSLKLAKKLKTGIPHTFMNYYNGLDHMKNPLHQSLEPFLRGYPTGFEVGDTVYGFYCCHFYLSIFYFIGLPLANLLRNMDLFKQFVSYFGSISTLILCQVHCLKTLFKPVTYALRLKEKES